jgi:hypothetical protein
MDYFRKKLTLCLLIVAAALLGIKCSPPTTAGTATETENVVGKLYQPDGTTPAVGVRVHIRPKKTLADTSGIGLSKRLAVLAATDSVVTDSAGRYAFGTTLDTGTYVIEATSGNDAVLIDSVAVTSKDSTDSLAPDTLKPAGALKGVIKLSEGGDPRKVFVLAFGIDRFAKVSIDGSFKFAGLAEAAYDLRLISSLDNYGVLDTVGVKVRSADTTNLDTISLPFTGIPTPKNVRISYDTLKQIVTLMWGKADTALVKSYNVYRRNVDSNTVAVRINTSPVVDTVYRDSTGVQDQTYEYRVAAMDKNATEGTKSAGMSVKVVGAFVVLQTYGKGQGSSQEQFVGLRAVAVDKNGNVYCVDDGNSRIQKFDSTGNFLLQWGTQGSSNGQFDRPMDIDIDSLGNIYIVDSQNQRIQKFDSSGNFIAMFGSSFNLPYSLAVHNGLLYVGEWNGQKVKKFDLDGNLIKEFSVPGAVHGISASDSAIFVIVNDKRLLKYSTEGALLDTIYTTGQYKQENGYMNDIQINGVFYDPIKDIYYLSDGTNKGFFGVDSSGNIVLQTKLEDLPDEVPQDIYLSHNGIYVALNSGFVQKYRNR